MRLVTAAYLLLVDSYNSILRPGTLSMLEASFRCTPTATCLIPKCIANRNMPLLWCTVNAAYLIEGAPQPRHDARLVRPYRRIPHFHVHPYRRVLHVGCPFPVEGIIF